MARLVKIAVAISFLAILGLPVLELWRALALLAGVLALTYSTIRPGTWRIAAAATLVAATVVIKSLFPGAALEEGHNIFLVTRSPNPVAASIPAPIYEQWRRTFEQQYPPEADRDALWRTSPPTTLFGDSSDALWHPALYTRRVSRVSFSNLTEFRGGFANDIRYNFYGGDAMSLTRGFEADLPFFVMYEFRPPSVGSALHWRGTVFWQADDGSFDAITHDADAARTITAHDVGRRIYALSLPPPLTARPWERSRQPRQSSLSMRFEPRGMLAAAQYADVALSAAALIGLLIVLTTLDVRRFTHAAILIAACLAIVGVVIYFSAGKYLGPWYPPQGAGDDGLSHDSLGRAMARELMSGDWKEALRGGQDVYWDTPGMRYVRFVERIVFGDTNLGYLISVALLPWLVYLLVAQIAGVAWAIGAALLFILLPFGSPSFIQYVENAKLGYAEAAGFAMLLGGLYLLLRSQPRWGGSHDAARAFAGGALLAGAMFVRPNLAIAVSVFGAVFLTASLWSRDYRAALAAAGGLALALWMPLHNYAYGHRFVLISDAGASISVPLTPVSYARAGYELLHGSTQGPHVAAATRQLSAWLDAEPRLPVPALARLAGAALLVRLMTLGVTTIAAVRYARHSTAVAPLAWTALAAQVPMLFIFAPGQYRYAMIAWDLCAIVAIVTVAATLRRQ